MRGRRAAIINLRIFFVQQLQIAFRIQTEKWPHHVIFLYRVHLKCHFRSHTMRLDF